MTSFRVGDKVQIDPALVNGGARKARGIGKVTAIELGSTYVVVQWSDGQYTHCYWELAPVSYAVPSSVSLRR